MIRKTKRFVRAVGMRGLVRQWIACLMNVTPEIQATNKLCRHPFWLRLNTTDVAVYDMVFTRREYEVNLPPPKVIVDAGANIGLSTLYFANRYPESRIIAIEPEPENYGLLTKNTWPYPNVTPLQAALWSDNKSVELRDPGFGSWGFTTHSITVPNASAPVKAVTVDRLMDEFALPKIDILKMDIEGAELEVLRGASAWISRVDTILAELHDHLKPGCQEAFRDNTGDFGNTWTQQGTVVASRCLQRMNAAGVQR